MPTPSATAPIQTTCPYCGVGCGVIATPDGRGGVAIQGDPTHPANFGRLCSKGAALADTVGLQGRLLYPEIDGRRAEWSEALDRVASRFADTIEQHGPDAVAFYVSGQLLTEDYYLANKLIKGFIGSANIDTNSRLCMSSTVIGHKRAFGEDIVPGCYEDWELAELVVLAGSNTAWCHPVLFQRLVKSPHPNPLPKGEGEKGCRSACTTPKPKIVTIDPRRTATSESADLHLAIQPGSDVILFNGLLHYLRNHGKLDFAFLEQHTQGFAAALQAAADTAPNIPAVAVACGVAEKDVAQFYRWFAATEKTVTVWSQGVNQSSSGCDKVNAILNVHLATGRIGRPGMGPFSLTGQPNAMGGREVGGLANQLAAHLDFGVPEHHALLSEFWSAPRLATQPGLKAVDLFQAIGQGRIKALWVMATNPAVSLPDIDAVRRALGRCEFVVVSECESATDLTPFAHVRLPALAWGEKDGTVTNSERRISRQRAFLPPPGEARSDGWMIAQVAERLGFGAAFADASPWQVFAEHARLSGYRNAGSRLFDISALAELGQAGYDALQPVQWPIQPDGQGTARLLPQGRARLLPLAAQPPKNAPNDAYPLILNTGRIRDQWHTMTRSARSPRLNRHLPEPYAEIHPADAQRCDIQDGMLVRLYSPWGTALARAKVSREQRQGSVFMPMHWSDRYAKQALANALVNPVTDPLSGQPEFKHTPLRIEPYRPAWQGFLLTRLDTPHLVRQAELAVDISSYCVRSQAKNHWRYELAGENPPADWRDWAKRWLTPALEAAGQMDLARNFESRREAESLRLLEWLDFLDTGTGRYRAALLHDGRLESCWFIAPNHELPPREWLAALFEQEPLSNQARQSLLVGKPAAHSDDKGKVVCACFNIGQNTLKRAITEQKLSSVEQIGRVLKAGSNCGSCIPELRQLLREA